MFGLAFVPQEQNGSVRPSGASINMKESARNNLAKRSKKDF